jgi:Mn2+/Fe2+ NRAMP family transporter
LFTGRGHGELIRERFGLGWAGLSAANLAIAAFASMITEFSAVAGVGELAGVSRGAALILAAGSLLAVVATGSCRRVERIALAIGLAELAFFVVAWTARPHPDVLVRDALSQPFGDARFLFMAAAMIGATFNPWMVFYQQSAVIQKGLSPRHYRLARADTAIGAVLTQLLTASVLVAAAATLASRGAETGLSSIGEISEALAPLLGGVVGRVVFCVGVLGAAMAAAAVSSLALAWGVGEVAGYSRSLDDSPLDAKWFYGCYAGCVVAAAALVYEAPDLVRMNVAAQALNAFLMPLTLGFLVALAATALPPPRRLRGFALAGLVLVLALVCAFGIAGGLFGLF